MTNLEKMNELMNSDVDKQKIINWAYMNRIPVAILPLEDGFEAMENSVDDFIRSEEYAENFEDEHKLWNLFLERKYID